MNLSICSRMTAVVVSISCLVIASTARADLLGVHDQGQLVALDIRPVTQRPEQVCPQEARPATVRAASVEGYAIHPAGLHFHRLTGH